MCGSSEHHGPDVPAAAFLTLSQLVPLVHGPDSGLVVLCMCSCTALPPVVRSAVPQSERMEHLACSMTTALDHSLVRLQHKAELALKVSPFECMLSKSGWCSEIPLLLFA